MVRRFDHVTLVVRDVAAARRFFGLLGFREETSVVIQGEAFERYMGVPGIVAEHVTLAAGEGPARCEVQLLRYRQPEATPDPEITNLAKLGFNHVCLAVGDLDEEVDRLKSAGVRTRGDVLEFRGRKLVFLVGPEGVTVELSEQR
jgi:catechol 2,3-dioxygenase-like lactoylglutathione lyase family enzyme